MEKDAERVFGISEDAEVELDLHEDLVEQDEDNFLGIELWGDDLENFFLRVGDEID
jgi:hypothetical protein